MLFLLLIWVVFYVDMHYQLGLKQFGTEPRTLKGLIGIIATPLLHADLGHIVSNSIPIFILGTLLFYFYSDVSAKVFFTIYFFSSFFIWLFARSFTSHIGASGVVYGLSGFLFFSGIIRKQKALFGVSLLVTFLYGTVIWGVFPIEFQEAIHYISKGERISWEGHLSGFAVGTALAYIYRKKGVQPPVYSWEINNDEDVDESNPYWMVNENGEQLNNEPEQEIIKNTSDNPYTVNYTFIPRKENEQNNDTLDKDL